MRKISNGILKEIDEMLKKDYSSWKISKLRGIGNSTINRHSNTSSEKVIYSKGGRPPKLSHRAKSLIVRKIITGEHSTAASLYREQDAAQ